MCKIAAVYKSRLFIRVVLAGGRARGGTLLCLAELLHGEGQLYIDGEPIQGRVTVWLSRFIGVALRSGIIKFVQAAPMENIPETIVALHCWALVLLGRPHSNLGVWEGFKLFLLWFKTNFAVKWLLGWPKFEPFILFVGQRGCWIALVLSVGLW